MTEPLPRLYETLVTGGLRAQLEAAADRRPSRLRPLRPAEASDRIAWHLRDEIDRALSALSESERVDVGVRVARALLDRLGELVKMDRSGVPVDPATVLHAVLRSRPDGSAAEIDEPLIPLLDSTLLTNAPGEPSLWSQLRSEIESADAVDLVMAFIRRSGITPLLDALRRHCQDDRPLRVLTTTYTGSTERRALDELVSLGADVRISYDLTTTRLHAKGLGLLAALRVLNRLRRLLEPHPVGPGDRFGVERTGLGGAQPRRPIQVHCRFRQLVGQR